MLALNPNIRVPEGRSLEHFYATALDPRGIAAVRSRNLSEPQQNWHLHLHERAHSVLFMQARLMPDSCSAMSHKPLIT